MSSLEELHLGRNKLTALDGLQELGKLRVLGVVRRLLRARARVRVRVRVRARVRVRVRG